MKEEIDWHPIATPPDDDRYVLTIDEHGDVAISFSDYGNMRLRERGWYSADSGLKIIFASPTFWAELPKGPAGPYAVKITADGFEVRNRPVGPPHCVEQDAKRALVLANQLNNGGAQRSSPQSGASPDTANQLTAAQNSTLAPTCPPAGSGVPQQGVKLGCGTFKP